jgi:hypothetical protein
VLTDCPTLEDLGIPLTRFSLGLKLTSADLNIILYYTGVHHRRTDRLPHPRGPGDSPDARGPGGHRGAQTAPEHPRLRRETRPVRYRPAATRRQ